MLYYLIMYVRNRAFDSGIIRSQKFNIPVIGVGNLSIGGTGKTPIVEYLTDLLLQNDLKVATLSRGYKRKTKGFILATHESTASEIGDEPFQIKRKFMNAKVAVCEKRVKGIEKLNECFPDLDVILLDDAFQHRSVIPGLNILLTNYNRPFYNDCILPSGNLREAGSNYKRADIIIITKSPQSLSEEAKVEISKNISLVKTQELYFSSIEYADIKPFDAKNALNIKSFSDHSVLLFSGISNPDPLLIYLKQNFRDVLCMKFADHHNYTRADFEKINRKFIDIVNDKKIVITSEKDISRIIHTDAEEFFKAIPLFYVPIRVRFLKDENSDSFNQKILNYVGKNKRNLPVYPEKD